MSRTSRCPLVWSGKALFDGEGWMLSGLLLQLLPGHPQAPCYSYSFFAASAALHHQGHVYV